VSKNTALQHLDCRGNLLTELDLSNCPKLNSNNVRCDDSVNITWPSTASASSVSSNASAGTSTDDSPGCNASMFGIVILFAGVIFARKH
ncbi:MAG: hypothetical protein IJQ57_04825, partial [Synergistaceae bacterium]|nr:hypothetical protein [Synergistaceae bacterium]